ncbi:hypothetical protein [Acidovorax sp. T1]|uniref:hypothetical protein n=1 Tax=Acidovorax sp. T1 TaxID=1858609 RepID=UPI003001E3FB
MVTHRPGILTLADQVMVLRAGQVQFLGPRDQVLAQMQAARNLTPSQAAGVSPRSQPMLA